MRPYGEIDDVSDDLDYSLGGYYWPNSIFATIFIYLNTPKEGGETTFPMAECSQLEEGRSVFKVGAEKGKMVFIYELFDDGNRDSSTKVVQEMTGGNSEKWMLKLVVWDPVFPVHVKQSLEDGRV